MAHLVWNFESHYLNENTELHIILPERERRTNAEDFYQQGKKYKVLWLLHGGQGSSSDWVRKSMIEQYACDNNLMVVMPGVGNTTYADWPTYAVGYDSYRFVLDELMTAVQNWFPASGKREDNFIIGLSMGGWGAAKFGINNPEKFAGIGILSSTIRNYDWMFEEIPPEKNPHYANMIRNEGGLDRFQQSLGYKTRETLEKIIAEGRAEEAPLVFMGYGDKDRHFLEFEECREYLDRIGMPYALKIYPGMEHEWRMWDLGVQDALRFFGFDLVDK